MKAIGAAVSVGLAAWCSLGALGFMEHGTDVSKVALLPPWWALPLLLVASVAVTRLLRSTAGQLDAMLGSTLALLPWLPIPLPHAALLWTGPFVVAVWIAVVLGIVAARERSEPRAWITDARRAPILAGTLALALYAATAWWLAPILPDGDAPHYLIMAQSLIRDGDLKIENNHRRGDDLEYTLLAAEPDFLERGRNGAIYSIHAPGLSILIAPAFFLFGYPGAIAFLGIVAAIGTALVWHLSVRTTGSAAAAWFGWACCALTVPFCFQSIQVFPDGLAATLLLLGALPLIAGDLADGPDAAVAGGLFRPNLPWLFAGMSLAILPWLQTRLVIVAACTALAVCLRARSIRQVVLFALVPALSAAAWFGFFYVIYGTPNPSAPYGALTQIRIRRLPIGFPGVFFDQQYGVIPNAPVYGVVLAGLVAGALRLRRWCWEVLMIVIPYFMTVGMFQIWFGGTSSPARLVAPTAMLLGVAAARIFRGTTTSAGRTVELLGLGVSVLVAAVLGIPDRGRLLFNVRDGVALWLEWSNDLIDLPRGLPSLFRDTPTQAWLKAVFWAACFVGAWWLHRALEARDRSKHGAGDRWLLSWRAIWLLGTAAMIALTLAWQVDRVSPITPATGELGLLRKASRLRPLAYDYGAVRFASAPSILAQVHIKSDRRRRVPPPGLLLSVSDVPAGTYQLFAERPAVSRGTLVMRSGSTPMAVWTAPLTQEADVPVGESIQLPVAVGSLRVEAGDLQGGTISSMELRPVRNRQGFAPVRPAIHGLARRAAIYGSTRVFFMDDYAYAEPSGFWVAGGRATQIVVSADSVPSRRRLYLRNVPLENHLSVSLGAEHHDVTLAPREETDIDVELSGRASDMVLRIATAVGIRPPQIDPGSQDFRYLGCWVEIR